MLRIAAREDLVIADAVVATLGRRIDDGAAGRGPAAPCDRGSIGYGVIATFRTPSRRLLKIR